MAVELTDEEMALERRAEELKKELFGDFAEFQEWMCEEFAVTAAGERVHELIVNNEELTAGALLMDMYDTYCDAKAWEQARGER